MSEEATNNVQEIQQEVDVSPEANENAEALSFDELDQLTDGRNEKELLSEAKKEIKGKENKSEVKAESNREEKEVIAEAAEKKEEEIKKLIAKYGEENLEMPANAIFKHKIDGEEVDVELQELLNNYSGKVSYDKKFQEFSSERKYFEEERNDYNQQIENINKYINLHFFFHVVFFHFLTFSFCFTRRFLRICFGFLFLVLCGRFLCCLYD